MSLSKPTVRLRNPAIAFLEWKGGKQQGGVFSYWDGANRIFLDPVALALQFIVLDTGMFSVGGFDESYSSDGRGFWSNEVRKDQAASAIITVRYSGKGGDVICKGTYEEIKNEVKGLGGGYINSVYGFAFWPFTSDQRSPQVINLQVSGSAIGTFFDFVEKAENNLALNGQDEGSRPCFSNSWVGINGMTDGQKGIVEFKIPQWAFVNQITQEQLDAAIEADRQLQQYLETYLKRGGAIVDEKTESEDTPAGVDAPAAIQDKVYDTVKWGAYILPDTEIVLGAQSYEQLGELKGKFEQSGNCETEAYAMLCEGCKYHESGRADSFTPDGSPKEAAGSGNATQGTGVGNTVQPPTPPQPPTAPPQPAANPFAAVPEPIAWREVQTPTGQALGTYSPEQIKQGLLYVVSDGAPAEWKTLKPAIEAAVAELGL